VKKLDTGRASVSTRRRELGRRSDGVIRSGEGAERSKLYHSARWKRLRARFLSEFPYCAECQREGRMVMATVVDHRLGHDHPRWRETFFDWDALQSLCAAHHAPKSANELWDRRR